MNAKKVMVAIAKVTLTLAVTVWPPLDNKYKMLSLFNNSVFAPIFPRRPVKSNIGIRPRILPNNTKKKIMLYPNSGEIYNPNEKIWIGNKLFEDKMIKKWLSLSPDIIGGCCRVGCEDIKKMRHEIDNYE